MPFMWLQVAGHRLWKVDQVVNVGHDPAPTISKPAYLITVKAAELVDVFEHADIEMSTTILHGDHVEHDESHHPATGSIQPLAQQHKHPANNRKLLAGNPFAFVRDTLGTLASNMQKTVETSVFALGALITLATTGAYPLACSGLLASVGAYAVVCSWSTIVSTTCSHTALSWLGSVIRLCADAYVHWRPFTVSASPCIRNTLHVTCKPSRNE